MFSINDVEYEKMYVNLVDSLKKCNSEYNALRKSKKYRISNYFFDSLSDLFHFRFKALFKRIKSYRDGKRSSKIKSNYYEYSNKKTEPNYIFQKRIAIYSVVTGNYDDIQEPVIVPNNCDYFLFTDKKKEKDSIWIYKEIPEYLNNLNNQEKNRYIKMHPHEFLPDYEYSIYVDGNVKIFTDVSEFVNKLTDFPIGIFYHDRRNCVYDELKIIKKNKKDKKENLKKMNELYIKTGMPHNYGLLQCNIIVRKHNDDICKKIMDDWWDEYTKYSKRDQLSLPHVLYLNNISIDKVGILGNDVYNCSAFRIITHN